VVFTDRGYDNQKLQKAIADQHGPCMIARGKPRNVQSVLLALTPPQSKPWWHMAPCLRPHRRLQWHPMRLTTHGTKRKRREGRTRDTRGYLRYGGPVQWVCSAPRKRPEGRRQYGACNAMRVTARPILLGERLRWALALFHKDGKQGLGLEEVATRG